MKATRARWILLGALAASPDALWADDGWGDWQLLEENDTFASPGQGTDEFYTQGLRLVFTREPGETWPWAESLGKWWGKRFWGDTQFKTLSSLVVGENHFTPGVITTFDADPTDRPFASLFYAGARIDMADLPGTSVQSLEFDLGLLGPPGLGAPLQKGFHTLRQHRIPKGWPNQLTTEPVLNALYMNRRQYGWGTARGHIVDVTRDFALNLGTLQTYPMAGATLRLGWRMTGLPASAAIQTAGARSIPQCNGKRCPVEFGFFAGAEARYFLRNGYYDGNLIGGAPSVDKDPFVYDLRYGAYVRWNSWGFSYTAIRRSREFSPVPLSSGHADGRHEFGSISISRQFDCEQCTRPDDQKPFWKRDWLFEFGIGLGGARLLPEAPSGRTTNGPSGRYGFAKGLTRQLMIGAEVASVTRAGAQDPASAVHSDTFLTTKAIVLSVRPFGKRKGPGTLRLRAGLGQGTAKLELTENGSAVVESSETGLALNVGADYTLRLGDQLSLGLDSTWGYLWIQKQLFDRASFLSTAVVVHWQP